MSAVDVRRDEISAHARRLRESLVATRRDLHMHPELSHQETRTAAIVADRLRGLEYEVRTGVGGNGVVGVLRGASKGRVVAFRADMDAFAAQDALVAPYRSVVDGVKHLCGHDAHTAIGLGIAEVLSAQRDRLKGAVKFLFQPAEEVLGGAKPMVIDGALRDPRPDAVFGWHVVPAPVGTILCSTGIALAGTDRFQVTFRTSMAEADALDPAMDHCRAALKALTEPLVERPKDVRLLATLMEQLMSGAHRGEEFTFVECGPIGPSDDERGLSFSVLLRAYPRARRDLAMEQIARIVARKAVCACADYSVLHRTLSPDTVNDACLVAATIPELESVVRPGQVMTYEGATPFNSEDFSFFTERIPGAFLFLGASNRDKGILSVPHSPDFDIDEEALVIGVAAMANAMVGFLERE